MPDASQPIATDALKKRSRVILIITTIIFGLLIIPGIGAIIASPLVFTPETSKTNPRLIAFMIALISFPVIATISILASWALYFKKRYRAAMWASLLPGLSILSSLVTYAVVEWLP
ncbi:MAG: hypothetical protein AB1757_25785 [Acidobacteriota bacterium]